MLSIKDYPYKTWKDYFKDQVDIKQLDLHKSWKKYLKDKEINEINELLTYCVEKNVVVYPYPELLFNAFNYVKFKNVKVVVLGQDPYPKPETHDDIEYPLAMGLSFSVPIGINIPSSLKNIYRNMIKYKHIEKMPEHGNLESWAKQGCLLLNTSLTVQRAKPGGCHVERWTEFTDRIISKLSQKREHLVFVLWGGPAFKKYDLIDKNKHLVIASSHPSGLSCNNKMGSNPSFMEQNHFGMINEYLKKHNIEQIKWT